MKKVYIKENQLHLLEQEEKEVTFYEFFINVKSFLKDLLNKPADADVSDLFKSKGISKSGLISKMKDIDLIKSDDRIDEVPVEEEKKTHPYGKKMVAKRYVKYSIPRKNFEDKIKKLYKQIFNESEVKHVFQDTEKLITDMLDMDSDNAYRNRGGYDKDLVSEEGAAAAGGGATSCGNVMQGGGGNPDAGQFITPVSPTQRRSFWKPAMKRNKDEKNGSITMNRQK
jgi:hypothetical protein